MIELVDSHAHLQEQEFESYRAAVVERALAAGVRTVIVPGVDLGTSESALRLAERYDGLYATAGFHPHEASRLTAVGLDQVDRLLDAAKVVAVGEIGLDFYWLHSPREAQIEALAAQLALAARRSLPVVVHCRDAWDALADVLDPWARRAVAAFAGRPLGVLHYFSGTPAQAQRYAGLGFLISIHTSVTHPKATQLRDVAAAVPLDALLVETDSPYGAPQSQRGKRNEPAFVLDAAREVAELRGVALEEVAAATTANARRLLGLGNDLPLSPSASLRVNSARGLAKQNDVTAQAKSRFFADAQDDSTARTKA